MTIQQIRYVLHVADTQSVNKAAKDLKVKQPSISSAIKNLEKELGIRIFDRSERGVSITAEGKHFLEYADKIMNDYNIMQKNYLNLSEDKKGFDNKSNHTG